MASFPSAREDEDVEMTIPQPIYEYVKPPRLAVWSQPALVAFMRERRKYEELVQERCLTTGEDATAVRVSIKMSVDQRVLEHVARYILKTRIEDVTDVALIKEIQKKAGTLMNGHIPDIARFFRDHLKMNLAAEDVDERVAAYFMDFDRLVEDHGWSAMLGAGPVSDEADRQRMKARCKILLDNIGPELLRLDVQRLSEMTHRHIKSDDIALYELVLERATRQQHFHQMQMEMQGLDSNRPKPSKPVQKQQANVPKRQDGKNSSVKLEIKAKVGTPKPPPRDGCLVCGGTHWLKECPTATTEQKADPKRLLQQKWERERLKTAKQVQMPSQPTDRMTVELNGVLEVPFCADSGADTNIISRQVINELSTLDDAVVTKTLDPPVIVTVAGGSQLSCPAEVILNLGIRTKAGYVRLAGVKCLVLDAPEDEFLLGKETLRTLGLDVDQFLEQLAAGDEIGAADDDGRVPSPPDFGFASDDDDINSAIEKMLSQAADGGFEPTLMDEMRKTVYEFKDVWRLKIGADPPADVEPMRITLKPDAKPFRAGMRKWNDRQRAFLRKCVAELEQFGLIRRNNTSTWAAAAHPVQKPNSNDYRVTVDYRWLNRDTVPIAGATPNLAVVTQSVRGAYGFGQFDLFKGFWQLPLHPDSQDYFSFVTEQGVFTPLRVPQGACDSAMHFQAQMNLCFTEMLFEHLLVWIDDLLLHARDAATYLMRLRQFFEILRRRRLKLNAAKCTLFARSVKWCGRVVDGSGIVHDEERLGALIAMPPPPTAAGLQHFLCASNWMRDSIVDYARGVAPLQQKLEQVMAVRGRRKTQLSGVQLVWSAEERTHFANAVQLLATAAKLSFPDADARVCLFTDASATGWATVVTQVIEWDSSKPVAGQQHQLIVCTGGLFTKSQANWSVIEKEAYPIVVASSELRYLLDRERGYHIFCDHANLIRVFSPDKDLGQHIQGKLQRWALKLVGCRYVIEHIAGEDNVWADIVSRWAQPPPMLNVSVKRVTTRGEIELSVLRPIHDEEFVWPTLGDVRGAQELHAAGAPAGERGRDGVLRVDDRPWVPADAHELLQRLLVVSHCGMQGHRGEDVMVEALQRRFMIPALRQQVQRFVRACLLCKHVKGGHLVQRRWQDHDIATKRNECLHMDYLYLGESYGDARYVLLLKDELTHFCELVPCDQPTAQVAADAILDWFKRFGLPETWVSDNGSHFKATLVQEVAQRLKTTHKFVPVYSPWLNGTVERVNRDLLQVLRVMLMELQWDTKNWTTLLPVIQANLNHSPVRSLGGHAPVELFTGLPAASLLDSVALPTGGPPRAVPTGHSVTSAVAMLREHMQDLHRNAVGRKEQRRLAAQEVHNGRPCNFEPGDFVLWSRVDKRLRGSKLLVRWVGPFKVVEALPHSYLIEHLLTGDQYDVHGSRLKFYHDSDLNVTAEIRQHVGNQGIVLGVREIVAHRFNRETQVWELCVAWQGLDDAENSWEAIAGLVKDVPRLVRQYIMAADEPRLEHFL